MCVLTMDFESKRPRLVHYRVINLGAHRGECDDGVISPNIMLEMGRGEEQ